MYTIIALIEVCHEVVFTRDGLYLVTTIVDHFNKRTIQIAEEI